MDMSATEDRLQQLALKLDQPFKPNGEPDEVCMLLGRRARELHRGYVRLARGGYIVASRALLRPALEVNILLRFIRQHPEHRAKLWAAEATRLAIQITEAVREHRLPEQGVTGIALPSADEIIEWRRAIGELRKTAAGTPGLSGNANAPLIPPLREQVQEIDTPETWQAYATGYLALNAEQHVGRFSFSQSYGSDQPDGSVLIFDDHEAKPGERELGSSLFASTLVIVSDWLSLGFTDEAERIRRQLVGL